MTLQRSSRDSRCSSGFPLTPSPLTGDDAELCLILSPILDPQRLLDAFESGDLATVTKLLNKGVDIHKNSDTLEPGIVARAEAQDQRAIHCLNLVVTVFAYHSVVRFLDNLSL
jgi:hypothetical protein